MTLSGNVPNTEVWVAHSPKESAIESPKWSPLAASDLVNCRSTEGKVGSIDELATKFKEYENAFNSEAAREILVQLVGAETCRHRPSSATSQIADLMMRALSNAIAEKDALRVAHLTKQLLKLFPLIEPTLSKFPPKTVAVWQQARAEQQAPMRQLEVWATTPATLETDGKALAALSIGLNRLTIPSTLRRVWLRSTSKTSLIRYLSAESQETETLLFLPEHESVLLSLHNPDSLPCRLECQQILQLLSNRTAKTFRVGSNDGGWEHFLPGNPIIDHVAFASAHSVPQNSSTLQAIDFAPFGAAQLSQGRVSSGILWGLGQVSLAALSVWQFQKVNDGSLSVSEREDAQVLTNVLATSFYLAVAGSITDSVLWRLDQSTNEDP